MDRDASNGRRPLRRMFAIAIAIGGLLAFGCSSSKPPAVEKTSSRLRNGPTSRAEMTVDEVALVDRLQEPRDAGLLFSDLEAMCTVRGLGDRLDGDTRDDAVDALAATDLGQLTHDDANAVADVVLGCTDFRATFAELYAWLYEADDEQIRCAVDTLSMQDAHDIAVTLVLAVDARRDTEQESLERFIDELGTCLGDEGAIGVLTNRFRLDEKSTPDQARCMAEHLVAEVGAGRGLRYTADGAFSGDEARTLAAVRRFCEH